MRFVVAAGWLALASLLPGAARADLAALARGDAAWRQRAAGADAGGVARPGPIARALEAYEAAQAAAPDSLGAHWRLLRALHFAGEFASRDAEEAQAFFERARVASERAFDSLDRAARGGPAWRREDPARVGDAFAASLHPDLARIHLWAAIGWASWARETGIVAAVRAGVIDRLRRYAERVVALEPGLEDGGAHRLLAQLHASLPRIPFYTGWVDRDRALPELDRALAIAPDFAGNRLLLAFTLLDLAPERRSEALALLDELSRLEPDPGQRVEELAMRASARRRLAEERGR